MSNIGGVGVTPVEENIPSVVLSSTNAVPLSTKKCISSILILITVPIEALSPSVNVFCPIIKS